jgi:hypothetical protein
MLDLEKMQKELDDLLASETKESLLTWLRKKRVEKYDDFFGEGEYVPYYGQNIALLLEQESVPQIVDGGEDYRGDYQYSKAA